MGVIELLEKAKSGESFVVVGRCSETILREYESMVSIFIRGDKPQKAERIMKYYNMNEKDALGFMKEKDKIRNFWLKVLFIIYCLLLITVLFLNNEYRMHAFQNINTNTFSKEHFEMSNIIPFATITDYISSLVSNEINTNIVIINFTTNLLLFAPMGFFISILYSDRIKNIKQFAVLMIVSALIVEVLQFITFRGSTDIDDVILNTIGAVIVYLLMKTKFVKKLLKKVIDISE